MYGINQKAKDKWQRQEFTWKAGGRTASRRAHKQAYPTAAHTAPAHSLHLPKAQSGVKTAYTKKRNTTHTPFNQPSNPSLSALPLSNSPVASKHALTMILTHPACFLTMLGFASNKLGVNSSVLKRNVCSSSRSSSAPLFISSWGGGGGELEGEEEEEGGPSDPKPNGVR